jgi:hypothetical protein
MATAHRPQTDGQTERANRQVQEYLRHYVNSNGSDWDAPATLAMLEFSLNSHVSTATATTAYELHLGRRAMTPAVVERSVTKANAVPLEARWRLARDVLHQTQEKMVETGSSSKLRDKVVYNPGDEVLLNTRSYPQLRAHKLSAPYYGPLKVKRMPSAATVELELPAGWEIHPIINIESVKRYERDANVAPPPAPIIDDKGRETFLIEKVIGLRTLRGRKQCRVRWLGYGPEHDSWEPMRNIAKEFVDAYRATLPKPKTRA